MTNRGNEISRVVPDEVVRFGELFPELTEGWYLLRNVGAVHTCFHYTRGAEKPRELCKIQADGYLIEGERTTAWFPTPREVQGDILWVWAEPWGEPKKTTLILEPGAQPTYAKRPFRLQICAVSEVPTPLWALHDQKRDGWYEALVTGPAPALFGRVGNGDISQFLAAWQAHPSERFVFEVRHDLPPVWAWTDTRGFESDNNASTRLIVEYLGPKHGKITEGVYNRERWLG